jgi:uncharacterized protein (DUF1800 family)
MESVPAEAETLIAIDAEPAPPPPSEAASSRRGFFTAAAAAVVAATAGSTAVQAQGIAGAASRVRRKPVAPVRGVSLRLSSVAQPPDAETVAIWRDPVARLVRRITLGVTKDELARAKGLGYRGYLEEQLKPATIDDRAVSTFINSTYPTTQQRPDSLFVQNLGTVLTQLQEATLYRAAFSKRQLHERMVEFWSDHFNIWRNDVGYYKVADDRDVIRRHALGNFGDLLRASAHSPAMMEYLDQTRSRRGSPNENYAREIMELHTVGADGGYTQTDVAELAKVFTGWTVTGRGVFTYDADIHDFGVKLVLGQLIPSTAPGRGLAGKGEAERFINFLIAHPRTAQYVSRKMVKFFLQYDPPDDIVNSVAAAYTRSRGDIPSMLRVIFDERTLMAAPAKYKRPYHLAVSGVRALGASATNVAVMRANVDLMGHSIFNWETPDGYPDKMEFWSGLVMQRWNTATAFANAAGTTFAVNPATFRAGTAEATVDEIAARCFGGEISASLRTRLADYLRPNLSSDARLRETLGLALSSSSFQWY